MRTPLSATLRRLAAGAGVLIATLVVGTRAEALALRDQYPPAPRETVARGV